MSAERTTDRPTTNPADHDTDSPPALVEFMADGWLPSQRATVTHPQLARLAERRAALSRDFPGCTLVIPAGQEHVRANDTFFRFRAASDFVYLMGEGEPGALLVMEPAGAGHRYVLYAREHNRGKAEFFTDRIHGELWVGRHRGVDESAAYYGVDACHPLQAIAPALRELRDSNQPICVLRGHNSQIDALFPKRDDDAEFATHLSEMRLIKDSYELAELRKACEISKRAFEDVIRILPRAKSEREIEAAYWSRARIEANDVGYLTIAASGHHACTLHWNRNDGSLERSALLLLDAGVECDSLYTADITRTLPIAGKYSGEQRAIYDIAWEAQRAGIDAVRAGNDFLEPNRRAMRVLAQGLIDLGILKSSLDEALDPERQYYRRYTLHNVSHMLGLDVHDCANARSQEYRYGTMRSGMVLTVEPGLYFQPDDATVPERFRGIGVRIEDDIAVTDGAPDNLSAILPSQADAVERWMAELTG
ncbi:MAG: aminopeptidase P family protein [Vulcanimicrobiaceae bacterium]